MTNLGSYAEMLSDQVSLAPNPASATTAPQTATWSRVAVHPIRVQMMKDPILC